VAVLAGDDHDYIEKGEYMPKLNWKVLTKKRGSSTQGLPPGKDDLAWVTNTVTLIYGERDAVLVDTFLSMQHSKELLDWVAESSKNLTCIYVTNAHGDLFFGLKLLLDRFPNARAFATASSVAAMQNQISPDFIKSFWEPRFPGQVPSQSANRPIGSTSSSKAAVHRSELASG
jgi:glyoxylase-like metal-dependent hydrolase (beta-lactamase superfamily II)